MAKLLEIKDTILRFYAKFDTYIKMIMKFILALVIFLVIRSSIPYMPKINSIPVVIILSLICCLLPSSATLWISGIVILLNLYGLSMEAALVGVVLFVVVYFIYFRFCPKDNIIVALTPLAAKLGIPYIMPTISGLLRPVYSCISVACGTIVYYFISGVHKNAPNLAAASTEEGSKKLKILIGLIADNKEMYAVLVAMILTTLVVYFVRRLKVDYAWIIAFVAGALLQIVLVIIISLVLSVSPQLVLLLVGSVISVIIGFVLMFFCRNLDYTRVERVQYEDDEYYYYVTAVPKRIVAAKEMQVKQFGNTGRIPIPKEKKSQAASGDTVIMDRKAIARELDIDEDQLD